MRPRFVQLCTLMSQGLVVKTKPNQRRTSTGQQLWDIGQSHRTGPNLGTLPDLIVAQTCTNNIADTVDMYNIYA